MKKRSKTTVAIVIVLLAVAILAVLGWRLTTPSSPTSTMMTIELQENSSPVMVGTSTVSSTNISPTTFNLAVDLLAGSPPTLGSPNAPVIIVEFGDYQCPTCGEWFHTQGPSLIQNLVDTGKAKLVWRDFDYFGPDSISASEADYAAGQQGKFWQFHDLLYTSQQSPNSGWASRQNLQKFAQKLGLNMTQFNEDFNSGKYDALINANHALGVEAGITETPTFFLVGPNGKVVTIAGDQPESVFEQAVAQLTSG